MNDRLSKSEIRKDAVQEVLQTMTTTVGEVATIVTTAVKDITGSIGGLATDLFEIREGARRARQRTDDPEPGDSRPEPGDSHPEPGASGSDPV